MDRGLRNTWWRCEIEVGWDVGREPVARATEMMEVWGAELGGECAVLMQSHRSKGGDLGSP